ncbi:cholesterol esterase [Streptomyces collinus Tu 365]|uniref:Cholesterol esterase n=1 Tax=Streptomyces collinus (strain DSM 40733 / Tue 365) TaxID=1214242 RepID=S5VVJ4_STRC3|nr:cholesterol esterase [Streptomyces collinus Tu 365]
MVMVPSVAATAAIGVALAQGALAASFSVSGQEFKVTADTLHGEGFAQYGAVDAGYTLDGKKTAHAVAVSSFNDATITNMCQSVVTPDVPFLGNITLRLEAGGAGHDKVQAHNLYIDVDDLNADAVFNNIDIGVAAKDASKGPGMKGNGEQANPFGFAQQADSADLSNVRQTAWATTAGTFKLSGLHMSLHKGDGKGIECY